MAHGINTTVVEIDPAVYELALKHFHLPHNHTAVTATTDVRETDVIRIKARRC